jgi:hypothetical protein
MTRKYNIICTEKYLLIVDDSEIKDGDYCLANAKTYNNEIVTYRKSPCPPPFVSNLNILKKIIAHLPLNGASTLDGVDLLPPLPDEVEKLANEEFPDESTPGWKDSFSPRERRGFIAGYNKAKEKYKYTEDDVIKIVEKSRETGEPAEYLMLHLQQPKMPIGFECEIEKADYWYLENNNLIKPKTTAAGLTQWAGKYTY